MSKKRKKNKPTQNVQGNPKPTKIQSKAPLLLKIAVVLLGLCALLILFTPKSQSPLDFLSGIQGLESDLKYYEEYAERDFSKETELLNSIRQALISGDKIKTTSGYNFSHSPEVSQVYLSVFQTGKKRLRMGANRGSLDDTLNRLVKKLREKRNFQNFDIQDSSKTRILFEIIEKEEKVDLNDVTSSAFSTNRFEPGIVGFKFIIKGVTYYYMPTDAVTYSHLTMKHVLNFMSKKTGISKQTNKISKRVELMKKEPMDCWLVRGKSFVTFHDELIPLYRGYPIENTFSKERILETTRKSVDWLVNNMGGDGSFLYYYDGISDSVIDHAHPNRTLSNNYNNILRHSGGTITLLRYYERSKDQRYLDAAKRSIDFLIENTRQRTIDGETAYHVFFNRKSKLGGTGIALVALMRYFMISGDDSYNHFATGMTRHLISRIEDDGEMVGYYIKPGYNNGNPILTPSEKEKKELFSFYYPGEALMGIALYEREMQIEPEFKKEIRRLSKKALDFLVDIRPKKYSDLFTDLPADGWLMQAIEEWSNDKEFQRKAYLDFVFDDARAMIDHQYKKDDSPFYDYPGTYYYKYGDVAYTDGARSEGLIAAYYLAKRLGKKEIAKEILSGCKAAAESLLFTYNSEQSAYPHLYPRKTIGSFRFKQTRQWVRVDSVQHTACFFSRLYPVL